MVHTCNLFPPRHRDESIVTEVAHFWFTRGWFLRQTYSKQYGWNLDHEFYLVGRESGLVGRYFADVNDLMDGTNEIAAYGRIL